MSTQSSRRTHRKRVSALRLSSDTTSTLPEYISTVSAGWRRAEENDEVPSDRPPDYPDSAEEADEETDFEDSYVAPLPLPHSALPSARPVSPRRTRRHHRRKFSLLDGSNDLYLDSLLARSVHALEMSNALLQTSMSTQSSLSAVLAVDSPVDRTLESSARGLSSRIHENRQAQTIWADDLEEISRGVEGLFDDAPKKASHSREHSISSSLPASSSMPHIPQRRRPSLLDLRKANDGTPQLHLSLQNRSDLVSPPPRALTQYITSNDSVLDLIALPSTLGLRGRASSHSASSSTTDLRQPPMTNGLHATPSSPQLTDRPIEPSTPAYNMLSSIVNKASSSGTPTPSTSFTAALPSFLSNPRQRSSERSYSTSQSPSARPPKSPDSSRTRSDSSPNTSLSSRSHTPKQIHSSLPHRPMTPPTEESSSSDGCPAKLTVQTLRKILDDQPPPPKPRPPAFLSQTAAPIAEASISNATVSVSRLFTKGKHTSSTRPPSPPRQSAMKRPTPTSLTPSPSPTLSEMIGAGVSRAFGSAPSSGMSTPKRISFAELPESYASSRPEGSSSKFRQKRNRRNRNLANGRGARAGKDGSGSSDGGGLAWWSSWLIGASAARQDERMIDDRLTRGWGGRMGTGFGHGAEDWTM